jgi:hypothetical protein
MPKSNPSLPLDDYAPVADRIELFYSRFPEGRITTRLLPSTHGEIVVKAFVYRRQDDTLPASTGLASERVGDGEVNMYACLENTETSAIGRALANLGFAASKRRPSREEMEKVERARNGVAYRAPVSMTSTEKRVASPAAQIVVAALHHDLLLLMERAEVLGFSTTRLAVIRERLARGPALPLDDSIRIEKALRAWVLRHARTKVHG